MTTAAWLIVRRAGCLWALPAGQLGTLQAGPGGVVVNVGRHRLQADEVLGLCHQLAVIPSGPVVRSAAPAGCSGLALCEHGPMLVVDPAAPPLALLSAVSRTATEGANHG